MSTRHKAIRDMIDSFVGDRVKVESGSRTFMAVLAHNYDGPVRRDHAWVLAYDDGSPPEIFDYQQVNAATIDIHMRQEPQPQLTLYIQPTRS